MTIVEWFDVKSRDHLLAYRSLRDTGTWPKNFIPDYVEFPGNWNIMLNYKLANAYVDVFLGYK